jgi:hypothetical protein
MPFFFNTKLAHALNACTHTHTHTHTPVHPRELRSRSACTHEHCMRHTCACTRVHSVTMVARRASPLDDMPANDTAAITRQRNRLLTRHHTARAPQQHDSPLDRRRQSHNNRSIASRAIARSRAAATPCSASLCPERMCVLHTTMRWQCGAMLSSQIAHSARSALLLSGNAMTSSLCESVWRGSPTGRRGRRGGWGRLQYAGADGVVQWVGVYRG